MNVKRLRDTERVLQLDLATAEETVIASMLTKEEILTAQALDYAMTNQRVKLLQARMKNILRPAVEEELATHGVEDISGHKHLILPNGVEVIHEKRASISINEVATWKILEEKGLDIMCSHVETKRVLDEDKIVEAYEQGLISPQEFGTMFSESVTWAMKVNVDPTLNPEYHTLEAMRKQEESNKPEATMPEVIVT